MERRRHLALAGLEQPDGSGAHDALDVGLHRATLGCGERNRAFG